MKTYFYFNNDLILDQDFVFRRTFKQGQEVIIDFKLYQVVRCNINTNGDIIVFVEPTIGKLK